MLATECESTLRAGLQVKLLGVPFSNSRARSGGGPHFPTSLLPGSVYKQGPQMEVTSFCGDQPLGQGEGRNVAGRAEAQ